MLSSFNRRDISLSSLTGRKDLHGLRLSFQFDILEVKEVDDVGQSLSLPLYLSVTWPERRLWINATHEDWDDDGTGPKDVSKK